jgi:hypothetical protein
MFHLFIYIKINFFIPWLVKFSDSDMVVVNIYTGERHTFFYDE